MNTKPGYALVPRRLLWTTLMSALFLAWAPVPEAAAQTAGVTVSTTTIAVREGAPASNNFYTVVLDTNPGTTVTITVTSTDANAIKVDAGSGAWKASDVLTFGTSDWSTAKQVKVYGEQDSDNQGEEEIEITHAATATDVSSPYHQIQIASVQGYVDDDEGDIFISPVNCREGQTISGGDVGGGSISLSEHPTGTVTVALSSSDTNLFTVSPSSLTYMANELGPQSYTLTCGDDNVFTPARSRTGTLTATANGANYNNVIKTSEVKVFDDERIPVNLSIANNGSVSEGNTLTITATAAIPVDPIFGTINIQLDRVEEETTAQRDIDYSLKPQATIELKPGNASGSITLSVVSDGADEPDERLRLKIREPLAADHTAGATKHVDISIADGDPTSVTLSAGASNIDESGNNNKIDVTVTLGRELVANESVTLPLTVTGATVATHYTLGLKSGNNLNAGVTISTANPHSAQNPVVTLAGAGARTATLELAAVDNSDATARTVSIAFGAGARAPSETGLSGGITLWGSPATINIVDDDGTGGQAGVTIAESGSSVAENGGTDTYTVVLDSEPAADVMVTVTSDAPSAATVNKQSGTAGAAQTLTFSPSGSNLWSTAQTITVAGVDDNIDNPGDSRSVTISHATSSSDANYNNLSVSPVTITVTDDDDAPTAVTLSVSDNNVAEDDGATTITVTATVQGPTRFGTAQTVAVTVAGSGGSNVVGFIASPSSFDITIAAGAQTGTGSFTLTPTDNNVDENIETVMVSGSLGGTTVASDSITLTDDLPSLTPVANFASASANATESAGTQNVTVNLNPAPSANITLNYSLSGTATRDADYAISGVTSSNGTVSVNGGDTSVNIPVAITDDSADETSETVILTLTSGTGYDIGNTNAHTLTITDNDDDGGGGGGGDNPSEVTLSVAPNPVVEGEEITVTASLSQLVSSAVTIPLVLTAGTAETGDYGALASIVVDANQPSGTGAIATTKDDDKDDETFTIALGTLPAGLAAGAQASVEVTITDAIVTSIESPAAEIPTAFALEQNYPNPFNPTTTIAFALDKTQHITLAVYDLLGQEVQVLVDGLRPAARYRIPFDATDLASGTYLYVLRTEEQVAVKTMALLK